MYIYIIFENSEIKFKIIFKIIFKFYSLNIIKKHKKLLYSKMKFNILYYLIINF